MLEFFGGEKLRENIQILKAKPCYFVLPLQADLVE